MLFQKGEKKKKNMKKPNKQKTPGKINKIAGSMRLVDIQRKQIRNRE